MSYTDPADNMTEPTECDCGKWCELSDMQTKDGSMIGRLYCPDCVKRYKKETRR